MHMAHIKHSCLFAVSNSKRFTDYECSNYMKLTSFTSNLCAPFYTNAGQYVHKSVSQVMSRYTELT